MSPSWWWWWATRATCQRQRERSLWRRGRRCGGESGRSEGEREREKDVRSRVSPQVAKSSGALFLETSASSATNVDRVFLESAKAAIARLEPPLSSDAPQPSSTIRLYEEPPAQEQRCPC